MPIRRTGQCVMALGLALCFGGLASADYEAGLAAFERGDQATALREFQRAADAGHPDALFRLGAMHLYGAGIPVDLFRALQFWDCAAEMDQPNAIMGFGFVHGRWELAHPPGLLEDIAQLKKEAAAGEPYAMFLLGRNYAEGWGVRQDYARAFAWWEKAAALGDVQSSFALGVLYAAGRGVAKDEAKARQWYGKVARLHHRAMYELGRLLADERGGSRDYAEAHMWWTKAAAAGEAPAMFRLGGLYAEGLGVPKDYGLTRHWHEKAAAQGYVPAMVSLGISAQEIAERPEPEGMILKREMVENVLGRPGLYLMEAYMWYDRAARFGDTQAATRRDQVAAKLSPEQLAKARTRAENWRPRLEADRH